MGLKWILQRAAFHWTTTTTITNWLKKLGLCAVPIQWLEENEIEEQSGWPIQRQLPRSQGGKAKTVIVENNLSTESFPVKFLFQLSSQTAHMSRGAGGTLRSPVMARIGNNTCSITKRRCGFFNYLSENYQIYKLNHFIVLKAFCEIDKIFLPLSKWAIVQIISLIKIWNVSSSAIPRLFERLFLISWENNKDCHITMPLSLKTVEG